MRGAFVRRVVMGSAIGAVAAGVALGGCLGDGAPSESVGSTAEGIALLDAADGQTADGAINDGGPTDAEAWAVPSTSWSPSRHACSTSPSRAAAP